MTKYFAKFISIIFHPVFIPIIGIYFLFNNGSYLTFYPAEGQKAIYSIIFLSTIILPLSFLPLFYFLKIISDIEISNRNERIIPYLITILFYCLAFYILKRASAPSLLLSYLTAAIVVLGLTSLITFKWKISVHMIGIGSLIGALFAFAYRLQINISEIIIYSLLIAGIIGTARLFLEAHKPTEIYSGFGLGIISSFIIISFF